MAKDGARGKNGLQYYHALCRERGTAGVSGWWRFWLRHLAERPLFTCAAPAASCQWSRCLRPAAGGTASQRAASPISWHPTVVGAYAWGIIWAVRSAAGHAKAQAPRGSAQDPGRAARSNTRPVEAGVQTADRGVRQSVRQSAAWMGGGDAGASCDAGGRLRHATLQNACITACGRAKKPEQALQLYEDMQVSGTGMTVVAYSAVVSAQRDGEGRTVGAGAARVRRHGGSAGAADCDHVQRAGQRDGDWRAVGAGFGTIRKNAEGRCAAKPYRLQCCYQCLWERRAIAAGLGALRTNAG